MTISEKPKLLVFAGNPMRYRIVPDVPPDPIESLIEIEFTDVDTTEDHTLEATFLGSTRTFTLKTTPSSQDHLPLAGQDQSPEQWAQTIYEYILNDGQLSAAYDIAINGATISLTALEADSDYDWTDITSGITGVGVTLSQSGQSATPGSVEGVRMQVWKNGNELIGEDYKPVDSAGEVRFEIQEYVYSQLMMADPPRFLLSKPGFFHNVYTDAILKYRAVLTNKVNGVFEQRNYSDPDNIFCYALAGGLNREDLVANLADDVDYFGLADTKKKFLTWSPPSRITDRDETHSLFFAFQAPVHRKYTLMCLIRTDQASLEPIAITPEHSITNWTVVEFLVGYGQMNLESHTNDTILSWQVYLVDEDENRISDIREFVIDQKYHENVRYFRFRNSWGAYDSLRCTGIFEDTVEHDRERVTFSSSDAETAYNAPGNYMLVSETQNFKANTGWLSRTYLNYLRDFMLSTDIYEVDDDRLLKCLLTSKKTNLFKDKSYNYSLSFEFERAYSDFFFQGLD